MPTDKNYNIDNINRKAMVAKDKYWKREEELARSGRNGGIIGATALYGSGVGFNAINQNARHKLFNKYRAFHKEMGKDIANAKAVGREIYSDYFNWATKQKPYPDAATAKLQQDLAQKYQSTLSEARSIIQKSQKDRKTIRAYANILAKDIREHSGAKMFTPSRFDAALIGLSAAGALYHQNKLNEAIAKRQSAGYASEKTASEASNLPDRLRYTHTIDTEVVPYDNPSKLELLKKYKKQLMYGAAASALAGGALYAAHKYKQKEKTANIVYVDPQAYDTFRNSLAPDIPRDWSAANIVGGHVPTVGAIAGTLIGTSGVLTKEWPLAGYGAAIAGGSIAAGKGANALYKAYKNRSQEKTAAAYKPVHNTLHPQSTETPQPVDVRMITFEDEHPVTFSTFGDDMNPRMYADELAYYNKVDRKHPKTWKTRLDTLGRTLSIPAATLGSVYAYSKLSDKVPYLRNHANLSNALAVASAVGGVVGGLHLYDKFQNPRSRAISAIDADIADQQTEITNNAFADADFMDDYTKEHLRSVRTPLGRSARMNALFDKYNLPTKYQHNVRV